MHVRSLSPIKGYIIIAVMLTVAAIYYTFEPLTPTQRCEVARAKIEAYKAALMDPEQYTSVRTRQSLVAARVEEIKWCEHPLSNGN